MEITLRYGCSPVHLQHIFSTTFYKNVTGGLLLNIGNGPLDISIRKAGNKTCDEFCLG